MSQDGLYEWVALEVAPDLLEVQSLGFRVTVRTEAGHRGERELFLGVLVDHPVEPDDRFFPLMDNPDDVGRRYPQRVEPVKIQHLLVSPSPFVSIIVPVHLLKTGVQLVHVGDPFFLDISDQSLNLTFGGDQSGNVYPFATAYRRIGQQAFTDLLVALEMDLLQPLDHGVAQEFMDGDLVETDAVAQRRVLDLRALVGVGLRSLARDLPQLHQDLTSLHHLLYRVWAEQVIIDLVQFMRIVPPVPFGPFLRVTDRADASQVDAWDEIGGVSLLDQVREGQVARVGMVHVSAHDEREGADTGGPEDVGVGAGLGAPLERALVNRSKFIHVVALV